MLKLFRFLLIFLVASAWHIPAYADPILLPLQGRLLDGSGTPIAGNLDVTFSLYPDPIGGAAVFVEIQQVMFTTDGHFLTYLGEAVPLQAALFDGAPHLWLGVAVQGDPEMQPRFRLGSASSAAFAQLCGNATTINGNDVPALARASAAHLIDAGGALIGPVVTGWGECQPLVYLSEAGYFTSIGPAMDRFVFVGFRYTSLLDDPLFHYETPDCTGPAYVRRDIACSASAGLDLHPNLPYAFAFDDRLWGVSDSNTIEPGAIQSALDGLGNCLLNPSAGVRPLYLVTDVTPQDWPPVEPFRLVIPAL